MVKKILVMLIIGVILIGSGYAVLFSSTSIVQEKHPDLVVFFDGELKQGQYSSMQIDLFEGEDIIVTILSADTQMLFSITGPDNSTLEEIIFFESLSHNLEAKLNGTYTINVANMDTSSADVMGMLSEQSISDDEFLSMTTPLIAASFLVFTGIVIVIVSIIILVLKKILSKKNPKNNK
jgi:uncharacterized membrane protein